MLTNRSRVSSKPWAQRYRWLIALILVTGIALAGRLPLPLQLDRSDAELSQNKRVQTVARRETRPTLDPALFVGKAKLSHQIAREIPDTLDQLYCYCQCDKHVGHKSLLSCYTDGHAAT